MVSHTTRHIYLSIYLSISIPNCSWWLAYLNLSIPPSHQPRHQTPKTRRASFVAGTATVTVTAPPPLERMSINTRADMTPRRFEDRGLNSARGLSSARGSNTARGQTSARAGSNGGWWANMQKSANPTGCTPRQGATRQEAQLHPLRSHRRLNTARDTIETPKRSKPSEREYDSPPPPAGLTAFSFKLQAEATMLLGAGEAEDRVILKGTDRVGLALWHECAAALTLTLTLTLTLSMLERDSAHCPHMAT